MQLIINELAKSIGTDAVQSHINHCLILKHTDHETPAALRIMDHLARSLRHILHPDEAVMFGMCILDMDNSILSVQL